MATIEQRVQRLELAGAAARSPVDRARIEADVAAFIGMISAMARELRLEPTAESGGLMAQWRREWALLAE